MLKKLLGLFFFSMILASCARLDYSRSPGRGVQTGLASWYGPEFHGRPTSNKEIFDMYDLTAAHRTLPFGTTVMVTNLDNGRAVTVRINDRGPFVGDRIIDLSYAAAKVLGMVGPGTVPVRIEVLKDVSASAASRGWSVQAGSFIIKENASILAGRLKNGYADVYMSRYETENQIYFRVRIKAADESAAKRLAVRLYEDGYTVIVLEEQ